MNPGGTNMSQGICSADEARLIGVKLFMQYGGKPNDPNSYIELSGVEKIFADVYNIIEQPFRAGPGDCEGLGRVLDQNSDGKITIQDMQALCVRYLAIQENQTVTTTVQQVVVEQPVQQVVVTEQVQQPQIRFTFQKAPLYQPPQNNIDFYNQYMAQLAQIFDAVDTNRDGILSQEEIKNLISQTYQMTFGHSYIPTQDEIYQFISANDKEGGAISKDQFIRQTTYEVLKLKGWV